MSEQTKALCIGINDYPGTDSDLAGCVNDAHDWGAALDGRGYSVDYLIDEAAHRSALIKSMTDLVSSLESGDIGVITYSGHGTWQADDDGDEPDLRDEALCPQDLTTAGALLDDDLFDIFSAKTRGARLIFISDSCHSGSVARLAPVLTTTSGRLRYLPPAMFLDEAGVARAQVARRAPARGLSRGTALLMSGCTDLEYSYDASFDGRPNGAFTRVALDALAGLSTDATYRDWFTVIREQLPSPDHPQTPQLVGSSSQRTWPVLQ